MNFDLDRLVRSTVLAGALLGLPRLAFAEETAPTPPTEARPPVASAEASAPAAPPADKPPGVRLVVKYDWTLTTTGGGGGQLGLQFDHFEVGLMGVATPLPANFRDTFLTGAAGQDVKLNWGVEAYVQWYPAVSRRWFFVGGILSVDGFNLRDQTTNAASSVFAFYAGSRVGLHIPLGIDWIFLEPSIGAAFRVIDSSLGDDKAQVRAQPVVPLTFLSIGGAIPL